MTRQDWREFGLHYISDDSTCEWHLHGSREGLLRFAEALERYAANPMHAPLSEHEHLGPHWYLTVTTGPEPRLDGRGIWGQPKDLEPLAVLLREALSSVRPGAVLRIGEQFTPNAEYALLLHVESEFFDPASMDPQLAGQPFVQAEAASRLGLLPALDATPTHDLSPSIQQPSLHRAVSLAPSSRPGTVFC